MAEGKESSSPLQSPSVSFAMDQPAEEESRCYFGSKILPSNTERLLGMNKQTKSILKKTESSSSSSANTNIKPGTPTTNLLKDANSYQQAYSPPKMKGLGSSVSEVEIIMVSLNIILINPN
jgi:hypothetical protein